MIASDYIKAFAKYCILFIAFIAVSAVTGIIVMNFITKPMEITVPDIKEKSIDDALEICDETGVGIRIAGKAFDTKIPLYHIISQSPEAGKTVKKGRSIEIIISKGSIKSYVPDIIGKNIQEAEMLLSEANLNIGKIMKVHSESYSENITMATYPPPGKGMQKGGKISLLVSSGQFEKTYLMPNLVGLSENQAYNLLDEMGLKLGELKREFDSEKVAGTVVAQRPPAGFEVIPGGEVNLSISIGGKSTTSSGGKGGQKISIKTYRSYTLIVPSGPKEKNIRVVLISGNTTREIYNKTTQPGKLVNLFFEVWGKTTLKVYSDGEVIAENNY